MERDDTKTSRKEWKGEEEYEGKRNKKGKKKEGKEGIERLCYTLLL